MCDYSIQAVKSRPAIVGEKLITNNFGTGTVGFAPEGDTSTAVCCLPGTELAFDAPVKSRWWDTTMVLEGTATFRQVRKDEARTHHDALEFPDGKVSVLNCLDVGQRATVPQLPAAPKTPEEAKEQERVAVVA